MANGLPEGVDLDALGLYIAERESKARLLKLCQREQALVREAETHALALRVLKIVAQPSDEQKEAITDAFWGKSDDGKYRLQHGQRVLAAILDMAKENPDGR